MGNNSQPGEPFFAGGFLYNPIENAVLLHLRDNKTAINPNKWGFFGGTSENGETPEECCVREWKEELGIIVDPHELILLTHYYNPDRKRWRYIFYLESTLSKSSMTLGEGADFDWIPLTNVFKYNLTKSTIFGLELFIDTLSKQ